MAELINENRIDFPGSGPAPLEFTSIQNQVFEILSAKKSHKYPLADCYRGAIYAAKNTFNPDRFSQAAHSLRELLEKLPRVFVESEIPESGPGFSGMRKSLYSRLCLDKNRYESEWNGKTIDTKLDATIQAVFKYLELSQMPTRKENIHSLMSKMDPMHDSLDQGIRLEKSERFHSVWKIFEDLAHHNLQPNEESFWQQLSLVERIVIDLLAPITAQDQGLIRAILEKPQPEQSDVGNLLELIKRRGANFAYFFKTVDNPIWINPLSENGFFKNLPSVATARDGLIITPLWRPIFYLQRVSKQLPEQVVEIILGLEQTENPRILREVFSIACDLQDTTLSLRLKPLIVKFLKLPYRCYEVDLIVKILKKWGSAQGPPRDGALDIIKYVIAFQPDPRADEKRVQRKDNPEAWNTSLEPIPRFDQWEYQQILENGVRPLAKDEPYKVSLILIVAVAKMIKWGRHPEDLEKGDDEDYSNIWCQRMDEPDRDYWDPKKALVQTLSHACEQVYAKAPESIDLLDKALGKHRWTVFKRLQQHLYASHPNEQTLPWIREQILGHDDYPKWEHHYEFQLMIRKVSEHFGPRLLSEEERGRIFNAILSGPSKEDCREWMGEWYSEETFQHRQRYFHRMQLRPFATLLSGDVRRYFEELESEASAKAVTDDSYSPCQKATCDTVIYQSPKSSEDLGNLTDEELLAYLNDWNEEHWDKDNSRIRINISALTGVFQSLFKGKIVPDHERLSFWLANRDRVARPVYVAAMLKAMLELVKEKNFNNLDQWIEFCAWVLSHPDTARVEGQPEPLDESRDHPDWGSSRRTVVDFINGCVNKESHAPMTARNGLAALLRQACGQSNWRLDQVQNCDDPLTEAVNNVRSQAIQSLVFFGFWIRRHLPEDQLPEVADILAERIAAGAEIPLTRPEHALLGMHFGNLCILNRDWAIQQRDIFFPQANKAVWRDAFTSYIRLNGPSKLTFEILRLEFEYAIENLRFLSIEKDDSKELIDRLGHHLFIYYFWEVFPLTGDESLIERFYQKTKADRKRWGQLFDYVGRSLRDNGKQLDKPRIDSIIAFLDWRIEAAEPLELQGFAIWLEVECLGSDYRLHSYSKILDLGRCKNFDLSFDVMVLNKLLPNHQALVVECFAKITDAMNKGTQMFSADEGKSILKAGLSAEDPQVRENAERAQENLLRLGRSDFLDLECRGSYYE